ncbi:MAG: DSBA oxidoreductase [Parcubacteria group bacterium Athens0714_16]|nr:MAG: DSBA oxidoreductase [Parcubacteria group bacterium Athens0714_16]
MDQSNKGTYLIAGAIVLAGLLIGFGVYFGNGDTATNTDPTTATGNKEIKLNPITKEDHILGNPNADVVVVEFSDTECPFCKTFHASMNKIVTDYGKSGRVAWVYRHFPLTTLHSKAIAEANATECAYSLGGNTAFWSYINKVYEVTPSNDGLDPTKLSEIAVEIGLDKKAFEECQTAQKFVEKVKTNFDDAVASGGNGTPHNILVTKNGEKFTVDGALPIEMMKAVIDTVLKGIDEKQSFETTSNAIKLIIGR